MQYRATTILSEINPKPDRHQIKRRILRCIVPGGIATPVCRRRSLFQIHITTELPHTYWRSHVVITQSVWIVCYNMLSEYLAIRRNNQINKTHFRIAYNLLATRCSQGVRPRGINTRSVSAPAGSKLRGLVNRTSRAFVACPVRKSMISGIEPAILRFKDQSHNYTTIGPPHWPNTFTVTKLISETIRQFLQIWAKRLIQSLTPLITNRIRTRVVFHIINPDNSNN